MSGRARRCSRSCAPSSRHFRNPRSPASVCRSKRRSARWRRTPRASRAWKRAPSRASNPARSSRQVVRLPPQCRRPPPPPRPPAPPVADPPRPEAFEAGQDGPPQLQDDFDEPAQPEPPPPPPPPRPIPSTARGRLLSARAPSPRREGLKGFRDVVHDVDDLRSASARAAQSARDTRDTYEPQPRRLPRDDDTPPAPYEPELDLDDLGAHDDDPRHPQSLEQSFELDEERPFPSQSARGRSPRQPESEDEYEHAPPPRSYVGLIKLAAVAC